MPIFNKVNGVWRDLWAPYPKVNGIWRNSDSFVRVNGVWREEYIHAIKETDIVGFRLIYKPSTTATHPDFPDMIINNTLPVSVDCTGYYAGFMNYERKGLIFQYTRDEQDNEGICVFEGNLYAILTNGYALNVGKSTEEVARDIREYVGVDGIVDAWGTNRMNDLNIQISGYTSYESYGHHFSGWNSFFETHQTIDESGYSDKGPNRKKYEFNFMNLLPMYGRIDEFMPVAMIGIARDMSTEDKNMVGSFGTIDHVVDGIYVNGVRKPFVIEYYN